MAGNSDQDRQAVERIIRQSNRLNQLIEEMLDVTRIQGEVLDLKTDEDVNLEEVTRRVIDSYAGNGREINLESGTEALMGNWDEARLEQVLHNLLSNALKYSPPDTRVQVRLELQGNESIVSIRDQGKGLSADEQSHIFERFYRLSRDEKSKVDGLGLGLYIAQQIIARFGGRIWV